MPARRAGGNGGKKMNVKDLSQYRAKANEINALRQKLDRLNAKKYEYGADSVSSSSSEAPYMKCIVTISGYGYDATNDYKKAELIQQIKESLKECEEKFYEIQAFINSIDDSMVRQIIEYKYIEGLTWLNIAMKMGSSNKSTPFMIVERFFEKTQSCELCEL
jgi:hypothetical protein